MNYKILAVCLILLLPFFLSQNVSADIGPKPTINFKLIDENSTELYGNFYGKIYASVYNLTYEPFIKELNTTYDYDLAYEQRQIWVQNCKKLAPKYNLDPNLCDNELQSETGLLNLSSQLEYGCNYDDTPNCDLMNFPIRDEETGCYWMISWDSWGSCENTTCHFGYHIPRLFRLRIYDVSHNKTYFSSPYTRVNFNSYFTAQLKSNGTILLTETTPLTEKNSFKKSGTFFIALAITLVLELLVAVLILHRSKLPVKRGLMSVFLANLISLPLLWFIFPLIPVLFMPIVLGELFVFVFEAFFIHFCNRKVISLKKSFWISFLANLTSLLIGGLIYLWFFMESIGLFLPDFFGGL